MTAAIEVRDVSKRFRLYREKPGSLKARVLSGRVRSDDFWALKDVTFDIPEGRSLGLIGHNGSGKTTLLKVIAGILRPTTGSVTQRGRLAALLELGAGFQPELTGRENVYLNAGFLGLSRRETEKIYDDVVAFSELSDFMDNAVKFYSSGMLVRLGFAVAVHVDPEILLIDEVLSVGDEAFQARCLDRVHEFQAEGRTIVFVTHALDLVRRICDSAVMLDHGQVHSMGDPDDVVRALRFKILQHDLHYVGEEGTREVEIVSAALLHEGGDGSDTSGASERWVRPGDTLTVQVDLKSQAPVDDPVVSFALHDGMNQFIFGSDTAAQGISLGLVDGKRRVRFHLRTIPFVHGKYWVTLGVHSRDNERIYHVQDQRYSFEVRRDDEGRDQVYIPVDAESEEL
ncbi:MAG: ABC transporter ATP-binding protein [Actinomycetota bacterium]|nr:ABC transporter ATP-binding protein [Actinomycetota bacterium]